jgi:hypothetical protein
MARRGAPHERRFLPIRLFLLCPSSIIKHASMNTTKTTSHTCVQDVWGTQLLWLLVPGVVVHNS